MYLDPNNTFDWLENGFESGMLLLSELYRCVEMLCRPGIDLVAALLQSGLPIGRLLLVKYFLIYR